MRSEELFQYLDAYLDVPDFPDYGTALNGVQLDGPARIDSLAVAVDASEETIRGAVDAGADLLIVHHGLFWGGLEPLTGRRFRKVAALIREGLGLYSVHLPLDAHPEVGNCAVLARRLEMETDGRFGSYEGAELGVQGRLSLSREALRTRLEDLLEREVQLLAGGPERIERAAVITGAGGSFIRDAARAGVDALVTGEASHHSYVDAMELGVNVYLGGHYATETWGVRALARHLEDRFGLPWTFVDAPSGL